MVGDFSFVTSAGIVSKATLLSFSSFIPIMITLFSAHTNLAISRPIPEPPCMLFLIAQ